MALCGILWKGKSWQAKVQPGTVGHSQVQPGTVLKRLMMCDLFLKSRLFGDIKLQKQEKTKFLEIMTFPRNFVVSPVSFE